MTLRRSLLVLLLCMLASPVWASIRNFPTNISQQGPWFILVQDQWINGCQGSFEIEVTASTIDIHAVPFAGAPGDFCAAVIVPFQYWVNPRDSAGADFQFDSSVTVNFHFDGELRSTEQVVFNELGNTPTRVQTGSWVTSLQNHGLFIDRQGDVMTMALFDYDGNGDATWSYGVGTIDGNVLSAELYSYGEIVCVTEPCDRTAPIRRGQVTMLVFENQLLATYVDALPSPSVVFTTMVYDRLDFQRPPELNIPNRQPLPDLVGDWIGGMTGDAVRPDDLRAVSISFGGGTGIGTINEWVFDVSTTASGEYLYSIFCTDIDQSRAPRCRVVGYFFGDYSCATDFAYRSVGVDRLQSAAACAGPEGSTESTFHLYRADD